MTTRCFNSNSFILWSSSRVSSGERFCSRVVVSVGCVRLSSILSAWLNSYAKQGTCEDIQLTSPGGVCTLHEDTVIRHSFGPEPKMLVFLSRGVLAALCSRVCVGPSLSIQELANASSLSYPSPPASPCYFLTPTTNFVYTFLFLPSYLEPLPAPIPLPTANPLFQGVLSTTCPSLPSPVLV